MARRFRWSVGLAVAAVLLLVGQAFAVATWGKAPGAASAQVGPEGTWNDGPPSIVKSGSAIVGIYDSDIDPATGKYTTDGSGRYMGVYALRSTNGGDSFSTPVRVSPAGIHGERGSIAASGSDVCVVSETQKAYYSQGFSTYNFDPLAPRFNYVTCSANGGSSWGTPTKLPGQTKTSRGDYPYMAAAGGTFYIVVTNSKNGDIWMWKSGNGGGTWTGPTVLGKTQIQSTGATSYVGGYTGLPAVGATGSNVGVAWMTDTSTKQGKLVGIISSNSGTSFGPPSTLAASGSSANGSYPNVRGADSRLAFAWTTKSGGFLKVYDTGGGTFGATRQWATFPDTQPGVDTSLNQGGLGPVPLLNGGTNVIGILWTECNKTTKGICVDDYPAASDKNAKMQLLYRQSGNNGGSFGAASQVDSPSGKYVQLDWADGLFSGNTPYAYYNAHNAAYGYYHMRLKLCTGC